MSSIDWIYCNFCGKSNVKEAHLNNMYTTRCGYIVCIKCKQNDKFVCTCTTRCTDVLKIDDDMPEDIKIFFRTDIENVPVGLITKVLEFQEQQITVCQNKFIEGSIKLEKYTKAVNIRLGIMEEKNKALIKKKENVYKLHNEVQRLKKELENIERHKPSGSRRSSVKSFGLLPHKKY